MRRWQHCQLLTVSSLPAPRRRSILIAGIAPMGSRSPPDRTPARRAMDDIVILDQLEMLVTSDPVAELDHALADTAARLRAAQARGDTLAARRAPVVPLRHRSRALACFAATLGCPVRGACLTVRPEEVSRMNWQRASLAELKRREEFSDRHLGPSPDEQVKMLAELGLASLDQLLDQTVPAAIRLDPDRPLGLPAGMTERAASARLRELAARNQVFTSLIGLGYHGTITPPVIQRNVLEDPAWYTAYTPYQPEIAQGRLEALLNFQTMVADLTGMELANASLLDEGSAAAEAMAMSWRLAGRERAGQRKGGAFFVDADCHPQTIAVLRARAEPLGVPVVVGDPEVDLDPDAQAVFGVLLQYPGSGGAVRDLRPVIERAHAAGALVTVAADLLALVLLVPPGKLGADIVVGSSQRFGVPMWFGGPHAAYMATREAYVRSLPGRLVGVSTDPAGRSALRLALQTREQHIRRERATSNICTAQTACV